MRLTGSFTPNCPFSERSNAEVDRKKNKIGRLSFEQILSKKSVITIKNTDDLCLACALVTVKACVDGDIQYQNI